MAIMTKHELKRLSNELRETRRYITKNVPVTLSSLARIDESLKDVALPQIDRLRENLKIAAKYIQVEPDLCRAYLDASAFELDCLEANLH